jgi:hypothetical protein
MTPGAASREYWTMKVLDLHDSLVATIDQTTVISLRMAN